MLFKRSDVFFNLLACFSAACVKLFFKTFRVVSSLIWFIFKTNLPIEFCLFLWEKWSSSIQLVQFQFCCLSEILNLVGFSKFWRKTVNLCVNQMLSWGVWAAVWSVWISSDCVEVDWPARPFNSTRWRSPSPFIVKQSSRVSERFKDFLLL